MEDKKSMKRKTKEEFLQEVKALPRGNEYKFSGEYLGNKVKMKVRHSCGYEYDVRPINFTNGSRCPMCSGLMKKDTQSFISDAEKIHGKEYEIVGEYVNSDTRIRVRHSCGNEYEVLPHRFLAGDRCLDCYGNRKYTDETFRRKVKELHRDEFKVEGSYVNNKTPISLRHSCGLVYSTRPDNFLKGHGCPSCSKASSKGEDSIESNLKKLGANYIRWYKPGNLKNKRKLEFDFAILDDDSSILALIEFDGIQHFESTFYSKNIELVRKRDKMKDDFCEKNNLSLVRISYKQMKEIPHILRKTIEKSSTTIRKE
jgi:predicted Zn-ribbon and HTH transcriptional regulator